MFVTSIKPTGCVVMPTAKFQLVSRVYMSDTTLYQTRTQRKGLYKLLKLFSDL